MQRRLLVGLLAVTHCNAEESYAQSLSITLAREIRKEKKIDSLSINAGQGGCVMGTSG